MTRRMVPVRVLAICAVLALLSTGLVVADPSPAAAAYTTTVVNFDAANNEVTRYDTTGNAVDAHDGDLLVDNGTYYLYGTSYDCGYALLTPGTRFCGFKVYSSPDLVHWTDRGYLFDAAGSLWQGRCAPPRYGCYRPHVLKHPTNGTFVLWINGYDNASNYHVFTSSSPVGPFAEVAQPTLAIQGTGEGLNNGDMDLFRDDDNKAYLAYTAIGSSHDQIVEELNADYTNGTGEYVRVNATYTEAPSLFRRGNTYYYLNGPNCPYCTGTRTEYRTASSPLGEWSGPTTINPNSCGGQPSFVAVIPTTAGNTYLYGSDLWTGQPNQALADFHWAPLTFAADGSISTFTCQASVSIPLAQGSPGSQIEPADRDQADGVNGFRAWCDIHATGLRRMQTFVASRTGTLTSASYTSFRYGNPNAGLTVSIVPVNASLQPTGAPLFTKTLPAAAVGLSPRNVTVRPHVPVTAGARYGIQVRSTTTAGCYGLTYNDAAPYPGGGEAYSYDGVTYTAEANRSSKFETTIGAPNLAVNATLTPSSSVEAWGWGLANVKDGLRSSVPSVAAGWSSDSSLLTNHPEWLRLDLGAIRLVQRVDLYPRNDVGNVGQGFPLAWTLEVSNDAVTWSTPQSYTWPPGEPPNAAVQSLTVGANARYIRITGTSLRGNNPNDPTYRMQLAEVEVY